ncbi:unnamed protein product, partial [Tetraodon nigroviridis]
MPNMVYIGGFQCKPAKPLPEHLEEFVQSSGEHGLIIMSLGTFRVLHDPSYRTNMQRLSRLHRDQPMKPMDTAVFWIEFVMRHKGAAHLRTESYKLPWYSYHSVDVVLFLTATVLLIIVTFATVIRMDLYKQIVGPHYSALVSRYFDPDMDYFSLFQAADLWLMRVDFVFEFPRPTMPNVVYMGGFQCKPAKPLPEHLEEFVQSSGKHALIIMSLGTLVAELPPDLADEIAAAFAKLPQKVIWRYKGAKPATLGNNTLLVDWMPQNDLLGHPKTKLFISHGGTNGIYEAIYHGVPILGLPLVFDQADNLSRMRAKGVAEVLDIYDLNRETFQEAIEKVLNKPLYTLNMQRLSRLHRDQPMKPMDTALFWIEFVMRHKGAAHLRTESYKL